MAAALPAPLRAAIDRLLEGVSRKDIAQRAARLSAHYRAGGDSAALADSADRIAYVVTRMPATFAAVRAVMGEVARRTDLAPGTLLDAGAGPGTASFAAAAVWPSLTRFTLLDRDADLIALGRQLAVATDSPALSTARAVVADIGAPGEAADLVVAAFALAEIGADRLASVVQSLWERAAKILVLVEPGTPAGFARIRMARSALIEAGASVMAPCPHDASCPILDPDWCHFAVRVPRSRDHRIVKGGEAPFEDEKYAYVALARPGIAISRPVSRVLTRPHASKAEVTLKLCAVDGLRMARIARRDREKYAMARRADWGDGFSP